MVSVHCGNSKYDVESSCYWTTSVDTSFKITFSKLNNIVCYMFYRFSSILLFVCMSLSLSCTIFSTLVHPWNSFFLLSWHAEHDERTANENVCARAWDVIFFINSKTVKNKNNIAQSQHMSEAVSSTAAEKYHEFHFHFTCLTSEKWKGSCRIRYVVCAALPVAKKNKFSLLIFIISRLVLFFLFFSFSRSHFWPIVFMFWRMREREKKNQKMKTTTPTKQNGKKSGEINLRRSHVSRTHRYLIRDKNDNIFAAQPKYCRFNVFFLLPLKFCLVLSWKVWRETKKKIGFRFTGVCVCGWESL